MIKMIVTDMDGTLLNRDLKISKRNLDAIQKIRDMGIIFCVATGRPDQLVKEYIKPLNMNEPMILYNGSVVGHPFQETRLYEEALDKEDVLEIIKYCNQNDIISMAYTKEKIISKPNYRVDFFLERNKTLEPEARSIFEDIKDADEIASKYKVQKILIIENDQKKYLDLKSKLEAKNKFTIATSQKGFIDINPKGCSKGKALEILAKHYDINLENVVVFGDQENDLTMLEEAGISVAMGNAVEKAKEIADYVTLTNNEDGVAVWIEEHILNKCSK
jgi:Cof subfamily protein (haloacid dehalogenase superfamily)